MRCVALMVCGRGGCVGSPRESDGTDEEAIGSGDSHRVGLGFIGLDWVARSHSLVAAHVEQRVVKVLQRGGVLPEHLARQRGHATTCSKRGAHCQGAVPIVSCQQSNSNSTCGAGSASGAGANCA